MKDRPAVVAVSGVKNSGKTTLITEMLPYLTEKGLRVAVIKHDGHSFEPDPVCTDTGRYLAGGCFFLSISVSSFIRAAFKICAVIFPPLMHSEMVFSLTSSCMVAHLPSIATASGADCSVRRRRGIAQHRAELLSALVQQIAALPFVAAMLAGMTAVRSRTLAHHSFKRIIGKIHRH